MGTQYLSVGLRNRCTVQLVHQWMQSSQPTTCIKMYTSTVPGKVYADPFRCMIMYYTCIINYIVHVIEDRAIAIMASEGNHAVPSIDRYHNRFRVYREPSQCQASSGHQAAMTIPNASEVSTLERPDVDQYASLIEGLHGTPHCLGISISEVIWHELPGVSSHAWFHLRSSRMRIPTRKKIEALRDEVNELTARLCALEADQQRSVQREPRDLDKLRRSELWKRLRRGS
ncbi:hypothetical protein GQ600_6130 [Phytophthora cactorum]|nr:hypothetical protein GQ600_6130 [Phytophthora cactorum]